MAIFRRRVVQQALDALGARVISAAQRKDIVNRLNSPVRQAIATEWEVVLLAALATVADLKHEPSLGNARLDILAVCGTGDDRLEFVADIVAISDYEIDRRNPVEFLFSEFHRIAHKCGCGHGGFDIRVGDREFGRYPDKRKQLLLPAKGEITAFLKRELIPFLRSVAANQQLPAAWEYRRTDIDLRISYDPKQRGGVTGGWSCPASPMSLQRNPLFAALNAKAAQLRRSGYAGIKGIFVMDADARALAATGGGLGEWSRDQIVEHFLNEHPSIHFVTTSTYESRATWAGRANQGLYNKVYWQQRSDRKLPGKLFPVFKSMFRAFPPLIESPGNAWRQIRSRHQIERGCNLGAFRWTPGHTLSISTRTFAGLLAETLPPRDFRLLFDRTSPPDGGPIVHFFQTIKMAKARVTNVLVERCDDDDDDWITFECSGSETAVARDRDGGSSKVELSMERIVRYLATLDYNFTDEGKHYSLGERIPGDVILELRACMAGGRNVVSAELQPDYRLRLVFGERDAAVAGYV